MSARVQVKAPWWTALSSDEKRTSLEKTKEGVGDTRYAVYVGDDLVGHVYSLKGEKTTQWFVDGPGGLHVFSDRFSAVRGLLQQRSALPA